MPSILNVFILHEITIRRVIAKYRPAKDDIDDLVQEAFLKCFAAELKHPIANPKAFVLRTCRNVAISETRRKRHSTTTSFDESQGMEFFVDDDQATLEDIVHSRRKLVVFAEALSSLPEAHRQALILRKIDGLKFKEIADRLGVSVSTVEKRVAAALLRCHRHLSANGYEPDGVPQAPKGLQSKRVSAHLVSISQERMG